MKQIRFLGRFATVIVLGWLLLGPGCASSEKKAREAELRIDKVNEEHRRYVESKAPDSTPKETQEGTRLVDGIAARVNQEIILLSEVERYSKLLSKRMGAAGGEDPFRTPEGRKQILERLIEMKLIEQRAQALGIVVKDSEVKEAVERMKEQAGLSQEAFIAHLAKEGLTYQDYLARMKKDIQKNRLIELEVKARLQVSDEACKRYYEEHPEEYTRKTRVRIQQILLLTDRSRMDSERIESLRGEMHRIREDILKGSDFGEMARRYSQEPNREEGGDCGYFHEGELLPEIERVAFSLKVGEIGPVVQTDFGFHLIRVMEREEGGKAAFEEVKESIRQNLMKDSYADRVQAWLQDLKERAFIDIRM